MKVELKGKAPLQFSPSSATPAPSLIPGRKEQTMIRGRQESEPESPPCPTPVERKADWEGAVAAASHSRSEVVRAPGPASAQG